MARHRLVTLIVVAILPAALKSDDERPDKPPPRRGPITLHVLNTATGKPAVGVPVLLHKLSGKDWQELGRGKTDVDGRAGDLYPADQALQAGTYRLTYETAAYFKAQATKTFFPRVEVLFEVDKADEHYHVPLLLSPFSYSTYRGS